MALEKSVEAAERLDLLGKLRAGNKDKSKLLCCQTFAYNLCPPKAIPMLFPRSSCQIMPEIFLPDVIPSCHRLVCTTIIGVKVNFLARCGQKSDLSGLCGIGYWVSGLVKCLPQSQWLLQSYKRSFDCKSNIKESSKSVAITII